MYVNKCIKCGAEFETKNPKRVICPNCLYPDKSMMPGDGSGDNEQHQEQNNQGYQQQNLSENGEDKQDYGSPSYGSGSYSSGGYSAGGYSAGGYSAGGYSSGGYERPQRNYNQGGYQQRGGYQDRSQGGYQQRGGYQDRNQGGYQQRRPQQGGFQPRRPQQGGFQRRHAGNRPPKPQTQLLISKEQLESEEKYIDPSKSLFRALFESNIQKTIDESKNNNPDIPALFLNVDYYYSE